MATKNEPRKFKATGLQMLWPNLSGAEGQYNRAGDRNFNLLLVDAPELEKQLKREGWNVKYTKPRDEEDIEEAFLPVAVNYKSMRKPRVYLLTSKGKQLLPEDLVGSLDYMDIESVDVEVNPYSWAVNGNSGVKAYLEVMFVKQSESELEQLYSDVPDADEVVTEHDADEVVTDHE